MNSEWDLGQSIQFSVLRKIITTKLELISLVEAPVGLLSLLRQEHAMRKLPDINNLFLKTFLEERFYFS